MTFQPSNELVRLAGTFVETIKTETGWRFNLAWSYGNFLEDLPQRLGRNSALDTSVEALTAAHSCVCRQTGPTPDALNKFSNALSALRQHLDDAQASRSAETLCAVMLIMMCQSFLGLYSGDLPGHVEGAAKLLKARRYYNKEDEFECKLIKTLRGPVLYEAMYNDRIDLTPEEWKLLVQDHLDGGQTPGSQMMRIWSRIPEFLRRLRNQQTDYALASEVDAAYATLKGTVATLEKYSEALRPEHVEEQADSERVRALALTLSLIVGCILHKIYPDGNTRTELEEQAEKVYLLSVLAERFRPLGAGYMTAFLPIAWTATRSPELRQSIETTFMGHLRDVQVTDISPDSCLREHSRMLQFIDPNTPPPLEMQDRLGECTGACD